MRATVNVPGQRRAPSHLRVVGHVQSTTDGKRLIAAAAARTPIGGTLAACAASTSRSSRSRPRSRPAPARATRRRSAIGGWGSAGADPHRTDYLLDAGDKPLAILLESFAGVAWIQVGDSTPDRICSARPPHEILVTTVGPSPVLLVSRRPTDAELDAAKDKIESRFGGCESTVIWFRHTYDAAKRTFAPSGPGRMAVVRKLCSCRKQP